MDHVLSAPRRKAVLSIVREQEQVKLEAQKQLNALNDALTDLRDLYVSAAGLLGEWQFAQNAAGEIVLRPVEKPVEPGQIAPVEPEKATES